MVLDNIFAGVDMMIEIAIGVERMRKKKKSNANEVED